MAPGLPDASKNCPQPDTGTGGMLPTATGQGSWARAARVQGWGLLRPFLQLFCLEGGPFSERLDIFLPLTNWVRHPGPSAQLLLA